MSHSEPSAATTLLSEGIAAYKQGDAAQAQTKFAAILTHHPDHVDALNWSAAVALAQSRLNDAEILLLHLLEIQPTMVAAHNNLGVCYQRMGRITEAIRCYERAQELSPEDVDSGNNLQKAYSERVGGENAETHCARLQSLITANKLINDESLWLRLARAAAYQGRFGDAIVYCRSAIETGLNRAALQSYLADCHHELSQFPQAETAYHAAIALDAGLFSAHRGLGMMLYTTRRYDEAEQTLHRAIELKPDDATTWTNLGNTYSQSWRLNQAIECFTHAEQVCPDDALPSAAHIFTLNYLPEETPEAIYRQALEVGRRTQKNRVVYRQWQGDELRERPSKLNIGFVSGDVREHAVGYFLLALMRCVDQSRFAWHIFNTHADTGDAIERELKQTVSSWHNMVGLPTEIAKARVHQQGIHILIDLSGHTSGNLRGVFACRPAPIQISWLGWFATTGLPTMDYLLTDPISAAGIEHCFSEELLYLPRTRLCMSQPIEVGAVAPLPAQKNGYITFASVQNLAKITDATLANWANILNRVPNARLHIQAKQLAIAEQVTQLMARLHAAGIPTERVSALKPQNRQEYLNNLTETVDILLDTHPYPGGTTTAEALWMGVPTITQMGRTMISRQGASLLTAAGLGDWVTDNADDYVQKAVDWAGRIDELAELRIGLRERVAASALFDAPRFARDFERALDHAWEKHLHRKLVQA